MKKIRTNKQTEKKKKRKTNCEIQINKAIITEYTHDLINPRYHQIHKISFKILTTYIYTYISEIYQHSYAHMNTYLHTHDSKNTQQSCIKLEAMV